MTGKLRILVIVISAWCISCTPTVKENCAVNSATTELELVATRRFNAGLDPTLPMIYTDTLRIILIRDKVSGDTVFGRAVGRLTDLGITVGLDTADIRPYMALCRGDSVFATLDTRAIDAELKIWGAGSLPITGQWATSNYSPYVEGEFTLLRSWPPPQAW